MTPYFTKERHYSNPTKGRLTSYPISLAGNSRNWRPARFCFRSPLAARSRRPSQPLRDDSVADRSHVGGRSRPDTGSDPANRDCCRFTAGTGRCRLNRTQWPRMKRIALIVGALAMAVLPGVAGDAGQWTRVRRIHAGIRIAIDLSDQRRVEGGLARVSESDLTYQASREITVSRDDIIRVSRRPRLSRTARALLGAAIGLVGGAIVNATLGARFANEGRDITAVTLEAELRLAPASERLRAVATRSSTNTRHRPQRLRSRRSSPSRLVAARQSQSEQEPGAGK